MPATQNLLGVTVWLWTLRHSIDSTKFFILFGLAVLESQWGEEWQMFSL